MASSPYWAKVDSPLEAYVDGFRGELQRLGYTPLSAARHVRLMAHLSRWLARQGLPASALTASTVEAYFAQRRAAGYFNERTPRALAPLITYLQGLGVVPQDLPAAPSGPVEVLLAQFQNYLLIERGLAATTAALNVRLARPFLADRVGADGQLDLAGLTAGEVAAFVLTQSRKWPRSVKRIVTAVRSLLRFAHVAGLIDQPLAAGVPSPAGWTLTSLPKGLDPAQVTALLAGCDRTTATGRRDFAILTLLVRLGLRAGEVATLTFEDIDWRRGELVVRGKGHREDRLPLPADVGHAIVDYLQHARPATAQGRTVFVRAQAPYRALTSHGVITVVGIASRRAGLGPIAAHRLRHTAATAMLHAGGSLAEIGQVLRHRRPLTRPCTRRSTPRGCGCWPARGRVTRHDRPPTATRRAGRLSGPAPRAGVQAGHRGPPAGPVLDYLDQQQAASITVAHALAWATVPASGSTTWHAIRLSTVRGFAIYLHSLDPTVVAPPADLLRHGPDRATPYLYSDTEIRALITAAGMLQPGFRAATYQTLIGLLAATGVRISEAIAADTDDLDPTGEGQLLVRRTKFGKDRLVPLHPSTTQALVDYLNRRDRQHPHPRCPALLVSTVGTRLHHSNINLVFNRLTTQVGIVRRSANCRPRIHDVRHSFAVATLTEWYRSGADVPAMMPWLATYLGHTDPKHTFWYLSAAPELMALAGQRLDAHLASWS